MKWLAKILGKKQEESDSTFKLFKDSSGQWWFFGIYSNKYKDRDEDILSESSHKEYAQWLKESGFRPVITAYHYPKMPQGFWPLVFAKYEKQPEILQRIV